MLARMMNDFAPLLRLHNDMNRLFEGFFEDLPDVRPYGAGYPALNTWEDGDAVWVEAELPGLTMADLEVLVSGNELTINGRREIAAPQGASYHRRERAQGAFSRSLALPWVIDANQVEATLRDGVLTVRLPKAESAKPKRIEVKTV
jgi:HSP20 family protein